MKLTKEKLQEMILKVYKLCETDDTATCSYDDLAAIFPFSGPTDFSEFLVRDKKSSSTGLEHTSSDENGRYQCRELLNHLVEPSHLRAEG